MKKQVQVYYTGRVQGIGFRYTAQDIAEDLGVSGWVKNLTTGMVELVAEAEEETLEAFLIRIKHHFSRYIQDIGTQWQSATGEFSDFSIRF